MAVGDALGHGRTSLGWGRPKSRLAARGWRQERGAALIPRGGEKRERPARSGLRRVRLSPAEASLPAPGAWATRTHSGKWAGAAIVPAQPDRSSLRLACALSVQGALAVPSLPPGKT